MLGRGSAVDGVGAWGILGVVFIFQFTWLHTTYFLFAYKQIRQTFIYVWNPKRMAIRYDGIARDCGGCFV
jgi:hypothetical protein